MILVFFTGDALIQNVIVTPFNIGKRIVPTDFTLHEALPFAEALTSTGRDGDALLNRVLYWTNGHPYLSQRVCRDGRADSRGVAEAEGVGLS